MLNYVIKSIEKDYSHFQLASCKSRLLKISEEEYKKLISKTTARLVESNLGQEGIFKIYEKGILDEMEKSKERIEIQCALLEKERVARKDTTEKWYQNRTIQAALITGGFTLIAAILTAILTSPLWIPFITKAFDSSGKNVNIPDSREITEIPSSTPVSENPDAGVINDFNSIASQELETKPPPMIKESKTSIEPEEREGNVNRSAQSSFLKIRETSITPEDTAAEVNKPPVKPFIKRDDGPIEPEKIQGKVEKRE